MIALPPALAAVALSTKGAPAPPQVPLLGKTPPQVAVAIAGVRRSAVLVSLKLNVVGFWGVPANPITRLSMSSLDPAYTVAAASPAAPIASAAVMLAARIDCLI